VTNPDGTRDAKVRVKCSAGTYIRTLAHDLGERLGYRAHLAQLRRISIGNFFIAQATPLDLLLEKAAHDNVEPLIIKPADLVGKIPAIPIAPDQVAYVRSGQAEQNRLAEGLSPGTWVRLLDATGVLVAMAQVVELEGGKRLQPRI